MESQFNAPDEESEHAPPKPGFVFPGEWPPILDEDPEIFARWVAAQQVSGVEARISELTDQSETRNRGSPATGQGDD